MIIVLIHWKIKPDQEMVDKFLQFWRQSAVVDDRRGLVGEFLTEAHSTSEYTWITWQLTGCEGKYRSFINVGYCDLPPRNRSTWAEGKKSYQAARAAYASGVV